MEELLPNDRYKVRIKGVIQDYEKRILALLYQPLIGPKCLGVYMALWAELELERFWSEENTHYSLLHTLSMDTRELLLERSKLEGIGLLETFVKEGEQHKTYIYEIQAPLEPWRFFNDGVLNIYLYNKVGKTRFNKLIKHFSSKRISTDDYRPVTKSFDDVFISVKSPKEAAELLEQEADTELIQTSDSKRVSMSENVFDFDLFYSFMTQSSIDLEVFTPEVKEIISKLSFVYQLSPYEMKKVTLGALASDQSIDTEELRKSARSYYQFEYGNTLPSLINRTQPVTDREIKGEPRTKDEQLIQYLERCTPYQLLMDLSGGVEPSINELSMIENILVQQKLNPGVVNVLIYYVMLRCDMKLPQRFVEKLAIHWKRKQIRTVKDAMDIAKKEYQDYAEWSQSSSF